MLFDTMHKLDKIVHKVGTPDNIRWIVSLLVFQIERGILHCNEVSVRILGGRGLPGGRGLCDLYITKRELGQAIIVFASENNMQDSAVGVLKLWIDCAMEYKDYITRRSSFIGSLKPSSQMLIRCFEDHPCSLLLCCPPTYDFGC